MNFLEKETLYIYSDDYKLSKHGDLFILHKDEEKIASIQSFKIKDIIFFGPTSITSPVLNLCQSFGINAHFLSLNTKYYGSLIFDPKKNLYIRLAQYKKHLDHLQSIILAKYFLLEKLKTYESCLQTFRTGATLDFNPDSIKDVSDHEKILGTEGAYTKKYYSLLAQFIKNEDFDFSTRSYNPPKDYINSLLSLSYTMLGSTIHTLCNVTGLDPYIGFLHKNYYGRPSLVCDFTEIWRGNIDKWVINLINRKEFVKEDFDENLRLKKDSFGKFLSKWRHQVQFRKYKLDGYNQETIFVKAVEYKIRLFIKHLVEEEELRSFGLTEEET